MKKKILALCLIFLMAFVAFGLVACKEHKCTFKEGWSFNDEYHWHDCEGADCDEVIDFALHSFEDGNCVCGKEVAHTHAYGEWTTVKAATFFEDGLQERVCAEDDDMEERAVLAIGKTDALADTFTWQADHVSSKNGKVILGVEYGTKNDGSGATYFGNSTKNTPFFEAGEFSVEFNVGAELADGDYYIFVLAFNYLAGSVPTHATEARIGVAKKDGQLYVNLLTGVSYVEATDFNSIVKGEAVELVETIRFESTVTNETELSYKIIAGGKSFTFQDTNPNKLVGIRNLWCCQTTVPVTVWNMTK